MFKKILIIPFLAAAAAGCSGLPADRETVTRAFSEQPVMRPDFEFVRVPASAFTFNETPSGRLIDGASQGTEIIQESFWISREPVTEKHFQYYMNGRKFPENGLSFDDAEKLFDNIFRQTAYPVMLPTESQLEAAFKAGVLGRSKTDEYLARDMWTTAGLPEDSRPWWASSDERQHDVSKDIVLRTLYERQATEPFRRRRANKVHMVLACDEPTDTLSYLLDLMDYGSELYCEPSDGKRESVTACGTTFEMLPVQGGKALLGATRE